MNMHITSLHHFDSSVGLVQRRYLPAPLGLPISFAEDLQVVLVVPHIEAEDAAHHQKHTERHDSHHHQVEKYLIERPHTERFLHVDPVLTQQPAI